MCAGLFLDEEGVVNIDNLSRTMHQPVKRGPVVKPDIPSDGSSIQIRSAPMWDHEQKVYKLIYSASGPENVTESGMALAYRPTASTGRSPNSDRGSKCVARSGTTASRATRHQRLLPPPFENTVHDADDADLSRRFKGLLGAITVFPSSVPTPSVGSGSMLFQSPRMMSRA